MARSVVVHPAAVRDADEAVVWYAERSIRAARRFLDELDRLVEAVAQAPERFPIIASDVRRAVFRRFPYYLAFRSEGTTVTVIAVAHGRRRPRFWRDRI